jgi:hypothetical protein
MMDLDRQEFSKKFLTVILRDGMEKLRQAWGMRPLPLLFETIAKCIVAIISKQAFGENSVGTAHKSCRNVHLVSQ